MGVYGDYTNTKVTQGTGIITVKFIVTLAEEPPIRAGHDITARTETTTVVFMGVLGVSPAVRDVYIYRYTATLLYYSVPCACTCTIIQGSGIHVI